MVGWVQPTQCLSLRFGVELERMRTECTFFWFSGWRCFWAVYSAADTAWERRFFLEGVGPNWWGFLHVRSSPRVLF